MGKQTLQPNATVNSALDDHINFNAPRVVFTINNRKIFLLQSFNQGKLELS